MTKFEVLESKTRVLLITKPRIHYNANLLLDKERICLLLVPSNNRTDSATIFVGTSSKGHRVRSLVPNTSHADPTTPTVVRGLLFWKLISRNLNSCLRLSGQESYTVSSPRPIAANQIRAITDYAVVNSGNVLRSRLSVHLILQSFLSSASFSLDVS